MEVFDAGNIEEQLILADLKVVGFGVAVVVGTKTILIETQWMSFDGFEGCNQQEDKDHGEDEKANTKSLFYV